MYLIMFHNVTSEFITVSHRQGIRVRAASPCRTKYVPLGYPGLNSQSSEACRDTLPKYQSKVLKCCSCGVGGANDFGGDTRVVVVCFPGEVRGSMVPRPHRACLRARGAGSCPENHRSPSQGFLCPFGTLGRGSALVSPPGASSHSLSNSAHRNCANMVMP